MRGLLLYMSIVLSIAAFGCTVKQEAAPSNATSVQVWSTLNGNDCFWTGKTTDGHDLMFRFSNHDGQWGMQWPTGGAYIFFRLT
jgi:hypothetical protein